MKSIRNRLLGTLAALCLSFAAHAAPPIGMWTVNANGFGGTLVIQSVDAGGAVTGILFGNSIRGFWTETSQRLVIYRVVGGWDIGAPPTNVQIFTGYQFPVNVAQPTGSQRLTGTFQFFGGSGGTAVRNVEGWYALQL